MCRIRQRWTQTNHAPPKSPNPRLAEDLPIGSGEVESGHRSVLQKRLKKPGAWWHKPNAESMGQIKTLQANGHSGNLWQKIAA
jgi:hypothetical protein